MNRKRKNQVPALILLTENTEDVPVPKHNPINSQKYLIGRGADADLQLLMTSISRNHCSLLFEETKNKWAIVSHSKRTINVQGKHLKKDDSLPLECGDEIKVTPFVSFQFKCAPDGQGQCCDEVKKAKLSTEKEKLIDVENIIVIDDDDDDDLNVVSSKPPITSELPDSTADHVDIYLNPTPSCSGVNLSLQSKIDSPLSMEELKKEIENYEFGFGLLKEDLMHKFEYLRNLKNFNNTSELYFNDPSENYKLSFTIHDLALFFEEEHKKFSVQKSLCAKSDVKLNRIVLNLDSLLMAETQLAMSFMGKFLQPAFYRTPENTNWLESKEKLMKLKVTEKDNLLVQLDTVKEESEKLKKENAELRRKLGNLEVLEYEHEILSEAEKFRQEDKRTKDDLQNTIKTLEEKINVLQYDNAQLLNDICSTADEISKLKEKCDNLEKTKTVPTVPSSSAANMYAYGAYGAGYIPPPLNNPIPMQMPMAVPMPSSSFAPTTPSTSNKLDSCSTMPFDVLRFLFKSCPISSEGGMSLRRSIVEHGVMEMLLRCLAILTHQEENTNSMNNSTNVELMTILNKMKTTYTNATSTTSQAAANVPSSKKTKKNTKSTSYYQYWAKGTGYGTGDTTQSWDAQEAMRRKKLEEENIAALLLVIASYVNPDPLLNNNFDIIQIGELDFTDDQQPVLPIEFVEMIEKSCLLPVLTSYLRNDSVLDMARHIPLYRAVMALLRVLAFNSQLVKFFLPPDCQAGSSTSANVTSSLIEPLEKMKASVDTYSNTLLKNRPVATVQSNGEGEEFNSLIADIQATAMFVEMNTDRVISRTVPTNGPQTSASASTEEVYLDVMKKLQFDSYDMIIENPDPASSGFRFTISHHYENQIRMDMNGSHPARIKRLAQEVATLNNSLPLSFSSSVFVRCDTARMDVMKVLIIGPAETPYMNGCFEFDVYFPPNYPNGPMLINLETTGRHSVRFNPNLYNEGKVCLSILNTWGGRPEEKWNAQTSSFLQVLVSIQSLILVPDPYFNEPGYERSRGTAAGNRSSRDYNANIRQATVQWAMLEQLRNPSPCFKTIIQKHFYLKRHEITKQVTGWLNEASGASNLRPLLQSLKEEFIKLELVQDPFNIDEED